MSTPDLPFGAPRGVRRPTFRVLAAAVVGNCLEWFDLIIYAFFALQIAKTFFPIEDPNTSLMAAFGTFGVSFVLRPLGGIVLGAYADRKGRKAALLVSMSLMMLGTLLIAVTPGYAKIGAAAPVIIVAARLLQGFSAGGEFASATTFLAEQSQKRRSYYASWQFASTGLTTLIGSAFAVGLTHELTAEQIADWGWRIPFYFGLIIGPVALYMRRHVDETPEFLSAPPALRPLRTAMRHQRLNMLRAAGIVILATVSMYTILYIPTYAVHQLKLSTVDGFRASLAAGSVLFLVTPISGLVADRIGRRRVAISMAVAFVAAPIPMFLWLSEESTGARLLVVQMAVALLTAGYLGAVPALLTDLFPIQSRSTGMSLSYNFSVMTFGGFAPFVITWLFRTTGSLASPGYYLAAAATLSTTALLATRGAQRAERPYTSVLLHRSPSENP